MCAMKVFWIFSCKDECLLDGDTFYDRPPTLD